MIPVLIISSTILTRLVYELVRDIKLRMEVNK